MKAQHLSAPAIMSFATASEKSVCKNPNDYKTENMLPHRAALHGNLNFI